jgi:hypothetical protein
MTTFAMDTFSDLPWHDSELLELRIGYGTAQHPTVTLDIVFRESRAGGGRKEVQFNEARGIYADVDLLAKELCSNQIASAQCEVADESAEPFVERLQERFNLYRGETMSGIFLFTLELINPSGVILILARSFSVTAASGLIDTVPFVKPAG